MDLAWRRAQTLDVDARTDPDRHSEWHRTVQELVGHADADDIALVTAHAWVARQAMQAGSDAGKARTARVAAELLWDAWRDAQSGRTPDVGLEHLRSRGRDGDTTSCSDS